MYSSLEKIFAIASAIKDEELREKKGECGYIIS